MVSRSSTHHEQLYVQPQGQVASAWLHFHNWLSGVHVAIAGPFRVNRVVLTACPSLPI
jgi:hypothetical protein